jgi:glycosyltransferase involved in cell wall biosynthesis
VSKQIRLYYPFLPYPVIEGSYQVVFDQAQSLLRLGHQVELVVWKDSATARQEKQHDIQRLPLADRLRITPVGEPREAGSGARSATAPSRWRSGETLAQRGLRVVRSIVSPWASPEIFHYPADADPAVRLPGADIGIYHYSFAYPWLAQRPARPERRVIVHLHNLESELARIRAPGAGLGSLSATGWMHRLNSRKLRAHEVDLHRLADELWFVSATDRDLYAERIGSRHRLRLVPPTYDLCRAAERRRTWLAQPPDEPQVCLGFIGTMDFEPNRLSIEWIVEALAPALAQRRFAGKIVVVGRGIPDRLRAAGDRYGFFEWCGFLPSLEEFWARLSFLLVPHIRGSGIRTKLLESLTRGVPALANQPAVAALRADVQQLPLLFVADSAADWAAHILAEREPFRTRRDHADQDLRGTSLDGTAVYRFLDEVQITPPGG